MSLILGLDIATATTGYTLLTMDGKLYDCGIIDTSGEDNLFEKSMIFKQWLLKIDKTLGDDYINEVGIENAIKKMGFGKTNAETMNKLLVFNALCSYHCFEKFEKIPTPVNVISARSKFYGKPIPRKSDKKQLMFETVVKREPSIVDRLIRQKRNKEKFDKKSYDIIDSYVIAYHTLYH